MKPLAILGLVMLQLAAPAQAADGVAFKSGVFDPPHLAPGFALEGSDGSVLTLERFRGKVVVVGFGFTHCPKVCPVTLANLAQAHKQLGADAAELQVIYLTVDPERDSPRRLSEYLGAFNPAFLGGTGTPEQLEAVRKAYGVMATRAASEKLGYEVHHSTSIYLVDRRGKLRALVPFGKPADDIAHDVRILLRERAR